MAVPEIIELLSLLKGLVRAKADLEKDYFQTFLQPIWESFIRVHENYIETSKNYYQDIIGAEADPQSVLLEQIFQDSIYSRNLRIELEQLIKNAPLPLARADKRIFSDFISSISAYFKARYDFDKDNLRFLNLRYALARQIGRQREANNESSEEYKKRLKKQIDNFMLEQQDRYERVSMTFYQLKTQLLK